VEAAAAIPKPAEVMATETAAQAKERIRASIQRQESGVWFKEMPRTVGARIAGTSHLTPEQLRNRTIDSQNEQIAARHEELRLAAAPEPVAAKAEAAIDAAWRVTDAKG